MSEDGYELFCNRDELRTRLPALPPRVDQRNGVRFIAPIDADAGGSWLAVNERGMTLCLLNYYEADVRSEAQSASGAPSFAGQRHRATLSGSLQTLSRGHLVLSLIHQKHPVLADVERYRPFLLLIFDLRQEPRLFRWNGTELRQKTPDMPVTTSSFDTANVIRSRREQFAVLNSTPCKVWNCFEQYHLNGDDAYSVCMSRPDAQTVSSSHVIVRPGRIKFRYRPRLPDGSFAPAAVVTLP